MAKRIGVANIVNKKTGDKYTIRSTNLDRRINDYFIKLEKGKHHNVYLQRDYDKYGRHGFKPEIVASDCKTQAEINRLGKLEIEKNGIKSYNIREDDVTFEGGDSEFPTSFGNDFTDLFEYLSKYVDFYNLRDSSKKELELKIETGTIKTKEILLAEVEIVAQKDKLLKLINESNLKSKDKKVLEEKVINNTISSETKLKHEIESIINTYKNISNDKKVSKIKNKNKSKPKKQISTKKDNSTSYGQKCSTCGVLNRSNVKFCAKCGSALKNNNGTTTKNKKIYCQECGVANDSADSFCANCGTKLGKHSYNPIKKNNSSSKGIFGRLFKIKDKKTGNQRFSKSKIISVIVFWVCFISLVHSALSYITAPLTFMGILLILLTATIYSIIPYVICRILGYIMRLIL